MMNAIQTSRKQDFTRVFLATRELAKRVIFRLQPGHPQLKLIAIELYPGHYLVEYRNR